MGPETLPALVDLSIVIPAYNEEKNIDIVLSRTMRILAENDWVGAYEVIVVDDGSVDATGTLIDEFAKGYPQVRPIHHVVNQGVGAAVATGWAHAVGEFVTYISGDGDVGVEQALNLFRDIGDADLMVSKRHRPSLPYREIITSIYYIVSSLILGFNTRGMEGIFVIRRSLLEDIAPKSRSQLLQMEVLMACHLRGVKTNIGIMEVTPRLSGHSKVTNPLHILNILFEMVKLRLSRMKRV